LTRKYCGNSNFICADGLGIGSCCFIFNRIKSGINGAGMSLLSFGWIIFKLIDSRLRFSRLFEVDK
jgi:hypothetical protein